MVNFHSVHVGSVSVVEPLAVVIHTELHLQPETEDYAKPRVELKLISNDVSVALRTCQVFCLSSSACWFVAFITGHCWFDIMKGHLACNSAVIAISKGFQLSRKAFGRPLPV